MLSNKDRKLARNTRIQSRGLADVAAATDIHAQVLLTDVYEFNGWAIRLTDEGIIDGIEALEHDLDRISDMAGDVQKLSAKVIGRVWEMRITLDKLKTRRINRTKEQGGERWERLKEENANERRN